MAANSPTVVLTIDDDGTPVIGDNYTVDAEGNERPLTPDDEAAFAAALRNPDDPLEPSHR